MIKIISDNGMVIEVAKASDITSAQLEALFRVDPVDDVLLTYVVTQQPTSRRAIPETE